MPAAPVIGAIVDFSPGINILVNPLTLNNPYYGALDFGQLATTDAYYVDITSQIAKVSIRRGRNRILSKFEAGTATVDIYDETGDWNPENTAGAYYPDLIPLRKIQIFADYNGTRYYLFTGFITNYVTNFNIGTSEVSRVTLRCVDAFRLFHGALVDSIPNTGAGQLSGTRVNEILDWIDYPTGLRDIDAGDSTLQADPGTSRTALQVLRNVEDSELGGFFIDAEGLATFVDRTAITQSLASPPYTFADDGSGIAFQATAINLDADILLNDVTVTRLGGSPQNDFDQASIDTYFLHSGKREDILVQTDAEALDMASMILSTRKDIELRIDSLELNLEDGDDITRCQAGLNIELLDSVSVTKNMPGSTTATQRLLVQGLGHDFTNKKMTTMVYTGESIVTGFILNSNILGIIDTNVLGY